MSVHTRARVYVGVETKQGKKNMEGKTTGIVTLQYRSIHQRQC
jgi:hypothetical protein